MWSTKSDFNLVTEVSPPFILNVMSIIPSIKVISKVNPNSHSPI